MMNFSLNNSGGDGETRGGGERIWVRQEKIRETRERGEGITQGSIGRTEREEGREGGQRERM